MGPLIFPEPEPGPRTGPAARAALEQMRDGLTDARGELLAAGQVEWVSAAADRYRRMIGDALADVARLNVRLADTCPVVLRHTGASDEQREAEEVECSAGILNPFFVWVP